MSQVVNVRAEYAQLNPAFSKIFEHIGLNLLDEARRIVIKINLCDYKPPETGATTHPRFLEGFLQWMDSKSIHSDVCVVESDASQARPDLISRWLGIDQIIQRYGARWVNLSKDTWSRKRIRGLRFHSLKVPDTIAQSDVLISMAKMKTHSLTTISCSLKNQFGCIMFPRKVKFHRFLDEAVVDACTAMKPDIAIVDGIIGMGGPKGPIDGVPIHAGLVLAGTDPVAVDSACAKFMGLNPRRIRHLRMAEFSGLGSMSFELVGDGVATDIPSFEANEIYRRMLKFATTLQSRSIAWG